MNCSFRFLLSALVVGAVSIPTARSAEPTLPSSPNLNSTVQPAGGTNLFELPQVQQVDFRSPLGNCNGCGLGSCPACGNGSGRSMFESDHEFDGFIEPVTNPVFFEDPRSRTRLRALFINQMIPENSLLQGGDFQVYAAQLTVALNERVTFIAQKDGYINLQSDLLPDDGGWADLATGLKYVFIRDTCNQFLVSGGFLYEWAQGSGDVFQGNGDGMWNFFLTAGKEIDDYHFIGTVGWHLPNNPNQESTSLFYSLHADREIADGLYAIWEMNGISYTKSGNRFAGISTEGGDLINLGASNVAGNFFLSTAFGGAYKFSEALQLAAAWEVPLTSREDLMDSRTTVTLSLIY